MAEAVSPHLLVDPVTILFPIPGLNHVNMVAPILVNVVDPNLIPCPNLIPVNLLSLFHH